MKKMLRRGIEFYRKYDVGIHMIMLLILAFGITIYGKDATFLLFIVLIAVCPFFADVRNIDEEEWP